MIIHRLRAFRVAGSAAALAALVGATGIALAGAVAWGLVALLFHVQLSVLGVLIGAGVGATVARFRPGDLATIIAGAVLAVVGCAFGTLLGEVFYLLSQHSALPDILAHLNLVLRSFPRNVGVLGLLFYAIAAFVAIWLPWRARERPEAASTGAVAAASPETTAAASGETETQPAG
jgi:hypothetical protein